MLLMVSCSTTWYSQPSCFMIERRICIASSGRSHHTSLASTHARQPRPVPGSESGSGGGDCPPRSVNRQSSQVEFLQDAGGSTQHRPAVDVRAILRHRQDAVQLLWHGGPRGLDRIDSSVRTYALNNCVPCCATCNFIKGTLPTAVFMAKVLAIAAWRGGIRVDTSTLHTLSNRKQCYTLSSVCCARAGRPPKMSS